MYRRVYDKYDKTTAGGLVLKRLCNNIGTLLTDIENELNDHEYIEVSEWSGDWYYIIIKDERINKYPFFSRLGITVNIKRDEIMWNTDTRDNFSGGNCFVRGRKWKIFANKYFGKDDLKDKKMWFYND